MRDAEMFEVQGENSAMDAILAASCAGGRTFTAMCSYGLAYIQVFGPCPVGW
jgi:pyruvate ferredoxin oxidoreductase alpha subunit